MFIRFELESFLHFFTYKLIFHFDSIFDRPYDTQKLKFFIMFTVSANWASKFSQMSSSSSSIGCISSNSFKSEKKYDFYEKIKDFWWNNMLHANRVILLFNMIFISPMLSNLLLAGWLIEDVVPEDVNDVEYDVPDVTEVDAVTDEADDVDDVTRLLVLRFIVAVSSWFVDDTPVDDSGVTGVKGGDDDDELIVSNFSSTS